MELKNKLLTEVLPKLDERPKKVLEVLLTDGEVSTHTISKMGYGHPPRAAMDLKEAGVKLIRRNGRNPETGNRMAIYEIDLNQSVNFQEGRTAFPKSFILKVSDKYNSRCNISGAKLRSNEYQVDHRIPFIICSDDGKELELKDFQLLSGSSQRSKSWACEHCSNYKKKDVAICSSCYWAFPEDYNHVAEQQERRVEIAFQGKETSVWDKIEKAAKKEGLQISEYIKKLLPLPLVKANI